MNRTARVLDIWSHVEPRFGGVGPAASSLSNAIQSLTGAEVDQIAVCDPSENQLADGIDHDVIKVRRLSVRGLSDIAISRVLRPAIEQADICHVHGMWLPHSLAARKIAFELDKPLVSSVHGMLEPWELSNKRLKKSLYCNLFERPSLSRSSCLRALTQNEAEDYRKFGLSLPIAVVPNGINPLERVDPEFFISDFPEVSGKSVVLFLGRVHHKKGVLNLLRAWRMVAEHDKNAHLVLAGPEYEDTGAKARQIIADLDLARSVTLAGLISGKKKLAALSLAKYFCLPSFSEGFSVAVLEALSIGLPAIITPQCNLPQVELAGAGRITSNDPSELSNAIIQCLDASPEKWQEMSRAASHLARSKFSWTGAAANMYSVYEWLLGGEKPDCVTE